MTTRDDKGSLGRWWKWSQDDSPAPNLRATEPYCSGVIPETDIYHQVSHFCWAIFLIWRQTDRQTWPRFSWGHACHSQKLSVSLRDGSGPQWAQEQGVQNSPLPLPTLLLYVQHLEHTAALPGNWLWSPISQDSLLTLLTTSPEGALSPPREVYVRPQSRDGSTQQGPCCPLLAQMVCACPPCSRLSFRDRLHEDDGTINKSY